MIVWDSPEPALKLMPVIGWTCFISPFSHIVGLPFKMKANSTQTVGKYPKLYSGITYILFKNSLQLDYQIYETVTPFKFNTTSKSRIGIKFLTFNDSFSIKDIEMYKL